MPESYTATTDIFNPKTKRPKDIVEDVLAAATMDWIEAGRKVEQEKKRFREAPVPRYDARQIVNNVRSAWGEYTKRPLADDDPLPAEATFYLKKYLSRIARTDADLQQQIVKIWPDLGPRRELTEEEIAELKVLQRQVDELFENLEETVDDALNILRAIVLKEHAIIHGAVQDSQPLSRQSVVFVNFLIGHISTVWGRLTGQVSVNTSSGYDTYKCKLRRWV